MAFESCPNSWRDCPHYGKPVKPPLRGEQSHGCFSDIDHTFPQRLGKAQKIANIAITGAMKAYIHSEENKVQMCRWVHDIKSNQEPSDDILAEQLWNKVHGEDDDIAEVA